MPERIEGSPPAACGIGGGPRRSLRGFGAAPTARDADHSMGGPAAAQGTGPRAPAVRPARVRWGDTGEQGRGAAPAGGAPVRGKHAARDLCGDLSFSLPLVEEEEKTTTTTTTTTTTIMEIARVSVAAPRLGLSWRRARPSPSWCRRRRECGRAVGLVSRVLERMRRSVVECFAVEDASLVQAGVLVSRLRPLLLLLLLLLPLLLLLLRTFVVDSGPT